ncbi:hypothetical protein MJL33_32095, partial [Salmonella enterica subsp. enterica serovar Kentucky]|nr:hypothetical protein [Salmonella enterica subsp. enterica serovar Kentucky]
EFESRLKGLLEEAGRSPQPVILFVDEVHTLVGAGGASGTGDAPQFTLCRVNRCCSNCSQLIQHIGSACILKSICSDLHQGCLQF